MLGLSLGAPPGTPLKILCLGAHSDDIEIGCGGTILTLLERFPRSTVRWVVLSADAGRAAEARRSAGLFLEGAVEKEIAVDGFRESFFPYAGATLKEYFEGLKETFTPDVVFTHFRADLHQDHRQVAELSWNTFRDHLILEYEVPKYDGDFGTPNVYVPLAETVWRRKIEYVLACFASQRQRHWFTAETFAAILRLRGMEARAPTGYAEAFYGRKLLLV